MENERKIHAEQEARPKAESTPNETEIYTSAKQSNVDYNNYTTLGTRWSAVIYPVEGEPFEARVLLDVMEKTGKIVKQAKKRLHRKKAR